MGLQQFVSWDVCGIARGKMVNYTDTAAEILAKKLVTSVNDLTKTKFSTDQIRKILPSIPKREAFKVSFERDIEREYVQIVSKDSTVVLPDLVTYLTSNGHNLNLEFEFSFLKEKMVMNGIYSDEGIERLLQVYINSGEMYVIGNGKVDINKNQKFKFKKPCVEKFEGGVYEEKLIEVEVESAIGTYNEKIDQTFVFTQKFLDERTKGSQLITESDNQVCMPNPSSPDWVVRHLNRTVKDAEFFTKTIFNEDVLKMLDEKIIIPSFSYRSSYENMDGTLTEEDIERTTGEEAVSDYQSLMKDIIGQ